MRGKTIAAALGLAALSAYAADTAPAADSANVTVPPQAVATAAEAPRKLSTMDFFKHPDIGAAKISPGGKYLAMLIPQGTESKLGIVELASMKPVQAYTLKYGDFIYDFHWVNDRQVVWETARREGALSRPYLTGHLMIGHADKSKVYELNYPEFYGDRVRDSDDTILVTYDGRIFRENVNTQRESKIAETAYRSFLFLSDHSGKVRMVSGEKEGDAVTDIWDDAKGGWKEFRRSKDGDGQIQPLAFAADDHHIYVSSNTEASTIGIYQIEPQTGESKLLFRDEAVDLDHILYDPVTDEPAGVLYFPDFPAYRFFDPQSAIAQTYAGLQQAFPHSTVMLTSASDDGQFGVVSVGSDTTPTEYYLLNLKSHHISWLFSSMPWMDPEQMSPMTPFVLKARDGLQLRGYLTLPKGAGEKNLPLVVLPHGGPMAFRDQWEFDPEVQFLAYHGYAVLQLNFRGSGGYGREFEQMSYRHWGTTMQDDLTDATHWAIQEGIADPRRICIYGASYGGYAALMGAVREPDLYRCAIGFAGAYDLKLQRADSDTAETDEGRAYLRRALGTDEAELKARSPVFNVDKIKADVLLVHGRDDTRVPYDNLTEMSAALDKAGKHYETLAKRGEGHGFYEEANLVEFHDRLAAFLDRNIGAGRPAAPTVAATPQVQAQAVGSAKP